MKGRSLWLVLMVLLPVFSTPVDGQLTDRIASIPLTPAERQWLDAHSVIRLAPDPDFPPVEFFDADGTYQGIAADYIALIEQAIGIRFEIVRLNSWEEVLHCAKNRQIDVLGAAMESPQRSDYLLFAKSHIELPGVIIVRDSMPGELAIGSLKGMTVAVVSGYVWQDLITNDYPDIRLNLVPDVQTGLRKVSFGIVDAMVGDPATSTYYIEKAGITNLKIAGNSGYRYELALASRKDWPQLHSILNKALAGISKGERRAITHKWIRLRTESLFMGRKFWIAVASILVISLFLISVTLAWNRLLKRQVRQRTEALAIANQDLRLEVAQRKKLDNLLSETQSIARVGGWEIQLPENKIEWTSEVYRIHDLPIDTPINVEQAVNYYHPDSRPIIVDAVEQGIKHGKSWDLQLRMITAKGRLIWVRAIGSAHFHNGQVCRLSGIFKDITDLVEAEIEGRRLEHQLRHSQKMEAVGQLAAGVSHEFNNILVGILCNADLLLTMDDIHWPKNAINALRLIKRSGNRAAALTRQLLAFSRKRVSQVTQLNLNDLIREVELILHRIVGKRIQFVMDLNKNLWPIRADIGEIEQIIINLVVNARDAMPDGGVLTISTANVNLNQMGAAVNSNRCAGPYVELTVTDVGCGMSQEIAERIFEPFFTTKPVGKGTGLGLSTVYGLVAKMHGHVTADSTLGKGAAFRVYLPQSVVSEKPHETGTSIQLLAKPTDNNELILVCDDEEIVCDVTSQILRSNGYAVVTAHEAKQALALAAQSKRSISLLLTDVVMPGMNGRELAGMMQHDHPGIKVIYMSGYIDHNAVPNHLIGSDNQFIAKPFLPHSLLRCVRDVLDSDDSTLAKDAATV